MDFKPFEGKSDDGAVMTVMHPGTGEPTDVTITLAGTDSKLWRSAVREFNQRNLKRAVNPGDMVGQAFDQLDKNREDLLASVTLSWINVELDGKLQECTHANARKLYKAYSWLLEQVNLFVGDRANFFRSVDSQGIGGDEGASAAAAPA